MPHTQHKDLFTSIEIGTDSIKVAIARALTRNSFEVVGAGQVKSFKVLKGEIVNALIVAEQLFKAIQLAEEQDDQPEQIDICDTFIGLTLSGSYINTSGVNTTVNVDSPGHAVGEEHVQQAIRNAGLMDTSNQVDVLSTSVRYHVLDDGRQLLNPIGMTSGTLQTFIQIVQAKKERYATPVNLIQNFLNREPNFCGYTPLSIGKACLPRDLIRQNAQLVIDLGAGVTSYALFTSAGCHTAGQITVGSEQAANDLSIAFRIPIPHTRNMLVNFKQLKCTVNPDAAPNASFINVEQGPGMSPQTILAKNVETIVRVRFLELFQIIREKLEMEHALQWLNGGTIFLSGGTALLPGITELAASVFDRPVEKAVPYGFSGPDNIVRNPAYVAVLGNIRDSKEMLDLFRHRTKQQTPSPSGVRTLWNAIKSIVNF